LTGLDDQRPLIVGLGSHHADDAVGWLVAEELGRRIGDAAAIRLARCPTDVLDWLPSVKRLMICDGCRGSGPPGAVRCWNWPFTAPEVNWSGTHDVGLFEVLALAERLGTLPREVCIWTVEVQHTGADQSLSPSVDDAVGVAVDFMAKSLV
jgi:hydrogenase maturation protease